MSAIPFGECQQRCIGQLAGVQPFSERKAALSACQVERQRRLDNGSRRLEHRGGDSHAPIRRHELVALGDHFFHFGGGIVHSETSSSLAAMSNFAAQRLPTIPPRPGKRRPPWQRPPADTREHGQSAGWAFRCPACGSAAGGGVPGAEGRLGRPCSCRSRQVGLHPERRGRGHRVNMAESDIRFQKIWSQGKVPVIFRPGKGRPIYVHMPYAADNRAWLRGNSRHQPTWVPDKKWWETPAHRPDVEAVRRGLRDPAPQGAAEVRPGLLECPGPRLRVLAHGCANHGNGHPGGRWHEVSDTFAFQWGPTQFACRHLIQSAGQTR
jgi:hypothetical protein